MSPPDEHEHEHEHEQLTPAEQRLEQHLTVLRDGPSAPVSLTGRVIRAARWQRSLRSPLLAVAHLAATVAESIRLLMRGRSQ